jgi:two-component system chemotaxis sensor kinase CheA
MEDNEYKILFLSEGQEILTTVNHALLQLEKDPADLSQLEEIFRGCHTLKGMAAVMNYDKIVQLAHAIENVLALIRKGKIEFKKTLIPLLFKGIDHLEALIDCIQKGQECSLNVESLINQLDHFNSITLKDIELENLSAAEKIEFSRAPDESVFEAQVSKVKSVRVNLERLEDMMNMVGELHVNKIRLMELARKLADEDLSDAVSQLEQVANKLRDETMQIRLLPLKYLLNYFPRMVRDAAMQEGKEVELSVKGADIGVDRTILDEINDPLIHILRNAVSHGIESRQERQTLGKPLRGQLKITACREQNFVVIEITDDGRGINKNEIIAAVLKQNLLREDEINQLSDEEILMLITLPGFSLSKKINTQSGRGVGMDVVKNKVLAIGGSLSIKTEIGKGTTFILRLPISMAIIPAILVGFSNETCVVPLINVLEIIKIEKSHIKHLEQREIVPYRNGVLPLIHIKDRLSLKETESSLSLKNEISIVVCEVDHKKVGLVVDRFISQQEVLIKNLLGSLKNIPGISGATILGNGKVAMILDVASLVKEGMLA